jgi:hypothetical protein
MTSKDLKIIDDLNERFLNLPQVTELRVNAAWGKISEEEYNHLFDTYKNLDDILTELSAFINIKFPNRQDLVEKWNRIDFDPKIGGIKIKTNDPYSIESSWHDGMSRLRALIKSIRAEVVLSMDDDIDKNNSNNTRQTNISGGQVIINEHQNFGNQSLSDSELINPKMQETKIMTSKTKSKKSLLEVSAWIAAIIGTIIAIITLINNL